MLGPEENAAKGVKLENISYVLFGSILASYR